MNHRDTRSAQLSRISSCLLAALLAGCLASRAEAQPLRSLQMGSFPGLENRPAPLAMSSEVPVAGPKELSNDSFSGGQFMCLDGFGQDDSAAVRLSAEPADYPYLVSRVRMLICSDAVASGSVTLRIWEDDASSAIPGPLLFEETYVVTGTEGAFSEVDLSTSGLFVLDGDIRVELSMAQSSPPGVGADMDGLTANVNYFFDGTVAEWLFAEAPSLPGDWIVRVEIEPGAQGLLFLDRFETGDTGGWSGAEGLGCTGNLECDDGDACTSDLCDVGTGRCSNTLLLCMQDADCTSPSCGTCFFGFCVDL